MDERWKPYPIFCPNCGKINYGYKNTDGKIKYECIKCMIKFVRVHKSRSHDTIDIYAPDG